MRFPASAAFHQFLADAYTSGAFDSLSMGPSATAVYLPLLSAGWDHEVEFEGDQKFTDPTGTATLTCYYRPGMDRWNLTVGSAKQFGTWSARFGRRVPPDLVAAFTTSLVADTPLTRTVYHLPVAHRRHLVAYVESALSRLGTLLRISLGRAG
jgi:hypothetical protein